MRKGFPTTVQLDGIFLLMRVPAPITTLSPMVMSPNIMTLAPTVTLFPIVGRRLWSSLILPIVVLLRNLKLFPMALAFIIVEKGWYIKVVPILSQYISNDEMSFLKREQMNALDGPNL